MIIIKKTDVYGVRLEIKSRVSDKELDKLDQAALVMVKAVSSPQFKEFCEGYTYRVKKYRWEGLKKVYWYEDFEGFWENEGKTQIEIYNNILMGNEVLDPTVDYEADIHLKVDRSYKQGVIGYTYPSKKTIWIYEWVLKEKDPEYIAGFYLHEVCHKLGYSHDSGKRKKHTVPYACGNYIRNDFKSHLTNN